MVNLMAPKSDASGVKQHLSGQPLRPKEQCVFFRPPLFQLAILGRHKNHYAPSQVHH